MAMYTADQGSAGSPQGLRIRADARSIAPDLGAGRVFIAGYDPDRPATGAHDEPMVVT